MIYIRESEQMFSTLFYKSTIMKVIAETSTGRYIEVNDAFANFFGQTTEELYGKTSAELGLLIHPEERDIILKNLRKDGFARNVEMQVTVKNGKTRWVSSNIDRMTLNGKDCFLTTAIDITDRKIAEEKLLKLSQELEQKVVTRTEELQQSLREVSDYKFALDESSIVAITDQKGIIKHANENFCNISKYSSEELIGQDHRIIKSGHHPKEFIRDLWVTIAKGEIWRGEFKNKAKDGTFYWVDTTIIPFLNEAGKPYQYLSIRTDISKRKMAEKELRILNEELEKRIIERTEELESFSFSVSHDLRAPLRAISGYITIMEENHNIVLDPEGKRLLGEVQNNAKRMTDMINDILIFSRLGRKEITDKSLINVNELIEASLIEINQAMPNYAEIKFSNLLPVMCDYALLKHVFINLLSNAIKYSSKNENPVIEINSKKENKEVIYSIKDNGAGFDMQYSDKLFGVFQRLHSMQEFPGTGVGLSIVRRIIHKHDGKVWAEGEVDKGATFFFSLPDEQAGLPAL